MENLKSELKNKLIEHITNFPGEWDTTGIYENGFALFQKANIAIKKHYKDRPLKAKPGNSGYWIPLFLTNCFYKIVYWIKSFKKKKTIIDFGIRVIYREPISNQHSLNEIILFYSNQDSLDIFNAINKAHDINKNIMETNNAKILLEALSAPTSINILQIMQMRCKTESISDDDEKETKKNWNLDI